MRTDFSLGGALCRGGSDSQGRPRLLPLRRSARWVGELHTTSVQFNLNAKYVSYKLPNSLQERALLGQSGRWLLLQSSALFVWPWRCCSMQDGGARSLIWSGALAFVDMCRLGAGCCIAAETQAGAPVVRMMSLPHWPLRVADALCQL